MLRYTLLYLNGGIYTDLDTKPLKPLSEWGREPDLFRQGRGWLFPEDQEHEPTPEELDKLKRSLDVASVVVGVESDVGGREDWHDWWPRPVSVTLAPYLNLGARQSDDSLDPRARSFRLYNGPSGQPLVIPSSSTFCSGSPVPLLEPIPGHVNTTLTLPPGQHKTRTRPYPTSPLNPTRADP
jgi:hypothetical protein